MEGSFVFGGWLVNRQFSRLFMNKIIRLILMVEALKGVLFIHLSETQHKHSILCPVFYLYALSVPNSLEQLISGEEDERNTFPQYKIMLNRFR
jgi:hypothetical protein